MKRILILTILLMSSLAWAGSTTVVVGQGGGGDCPVGATFYWDGDHPSGNLYACNASGDALLGTNSGGSLSTDYGDGGSVGVLFDTKDKYIEFAITSAELDEDEGTLWVEVYLSADNTASLAFLEIVNSSASSTNRMYLQHGNSGVSLVCNRVGGGATDEAYASTLSEGAWVTVGMTWSVARETADFSGSVNKGTSWEDDADSIAAMASAPNRLRLGNLDVSSESGQQYQINRVAVVSGWKGSCPW